MIYLVLKLNFLVSVFLYNKKIQQVTFLWLKNFRPLAPRVGLEPTKASLRNTAYPKPAFPSGAVNLAENAKPVFSMLFNDSFRVSWRCY